MPCNKHQGDTIGLTRSTSHIRTSAGLASTPTSGRLHVEPGEQLWVHQRQEHHLLEGAHVLGQAANLQGGGLVGRQHTSQIFRTAAVWRLCS